MCDVTLLADPLPPLKTMSQTVNVLVPPPPHLRRDVIFERPYSSMRSRWSGKQRNDGVASFCEAHTQYI